LLTLTIYFPFPAEQFCMVVKLFAQQPLPCCFRLFVLFQDIKNGSIDDRQKQAPCRFRMELLSLKCHVGPPFPFVWIPHLHSLHLKHEKTQNERTFN
jgi:hypothetical protein